MPKKRAPEHENHERWLVSYADFITLLFAFFVVMFASSQTDKARAKQVSEAVEKALDHGSSISVPPAVAKVLGGTVDDKGQGNAMMRGPGGAQHAVKDAPPESVIELMPSLERLNKELANEIQEGKLEVRMEPRGLVISLRQSAFFSSGTDALDQSNLPVLSKLADLIATLPNSIQLEGHTDSIPIHTSTHPAAFRPRTVRSVIRSARDCILNGTAASLFVTSSTNSSTHPRFSANTSSPNQICCTFSRAFRSLISSATAAAGRS